LSVCVLISHMSACPWTLSPATRVRAFCAPCQVSSGLEAMRLTTTDMALTTLHVQPIPVKQAALELRLRRDGRLLIALRESASCPRSPTLFFKMQDASKVSLIPHHVGRNLTSHSPELCHILSRLLNLKNVSTTHFTSEKLASLVANSETLGRFLVSRSSYIQHKDCFVRLTIGSSGWTAIRAAKLWMAKAAEVE
jgi:hypothetical protein